MAPARVVTVLVAPVLLAAALSLAGPLAAQTLAPGGMAPAPSLAEPQPPAPGLAPMIPRPEPRADTRKSDLVLSALMTPHDATPIAKGPIRWRVFAEAVDAQGKHALVAQSTDAQPQLKVAPGTYIVHAALDLASAVRRVTVQGQASSERLVLNAGALRVVGTLGDKPINPAKLSISIFVPEAGNSEAKLVLAGAKAGDLIGLPEGSYHVVSTLLDTAGYAGVQKSGVGNKTNSVVAADLKVTAGKLTDATLRHRSAVMTLKLVNDVGGEALANTSFTILTPGGDVIRELIGAFPSLVLAEGEYDASARHDAKTFQTTFKVSSTLDRDVEVLAK